MKKFTFTLLTLTLAFVSFGFDGCKETKPDYKTNDPFATSKDILKKYPQAADRVIKIYKDPSTVKVKTPKGASVWLEPGVTAEAWELEKIDEGIARTFAKAKCDGLQSTLFSHSSWTVALLSSVLSAEDKVPSIAIPYFGGIAGIKSDTEFITVAGQFLFLRDSVVGEANVVALADHTDKNMVEAMANAAENELEHGILADADAARHRETMYHQRGPHPLIADCR